ncbi:hypothetical protein D3C71_1532080 [compost metagenome]
MAGVMPAATVRSTFWLCSILLASRRATTSTSSVCWATTRRTASWPDARVTSQADNAPDKATASTATSTSRSTRVPGTHQPGASCGGAGGVAGVMDTPGGRRRAGAEGERCSWDRSNRASPNKYTQPPQPRAWVEPSLHPKEKP